ncbi:MAG: hypothetical protein R3A48_22470 [Polyangiales bacterium]
MRAFLCASARLRYHCAGEALVKDIPRIIVAVTLGLMVGAAVNMALVMLGGALVAPPAGAVVTDQESLRRSMPLFGPQHFLFPFLAHAAGSLVGALVAAKLAPPAAWRWSLLVGGCFLVGGAQMARALPAPAWFISADLILAYLPAAWLGARLARRGAAPSGRVEV